MKQNLTQSDVLRILREKQPFLQQAYGVEKLAIFGSFAINKPSTRSDIDIIVHLSKPLGYRFFRLAADLEKSLGRKVDLVTYETLQNSMLDPRRSHIANEIRRTMIYV